MAEDFLLVILTFDATIRVSVPLILAALAGLVVERSGVIDIGLEGKMLAAAFGAATVAALTGSAWLGLLGGMGVSVLLALLHGFACITHRGNQIVSGVAINILASGLTVLLGISWFSMGGQTPPLTGHARFKSINLPGAEAVADVPVVGQLYSELLSGHNILVYLAFLTVPAVWWLIYRTRFGLRLRATGENPAAVDTAGISVIRMRYLALIICGILCGIAGSYLSTGHGAGFLREMTAGKGFIALAAMIFGKWRPVPVLLACLLFGFLDAIAIRMQGVELPLVGEMSVQFIQALPYILTVVLLAGFIGRAVAPKASGIPYVKEH
ncbi:MAG: ABC transporter permease [Rhodospirillaceae bacterium]|jgi:general nucleoside transport system permease protein|nr:ABC transporter permease [Rhodospirillaceae bacterium]MBT5192467.1 ABC transporter permease [Rhodospirillaceae bacterium]MBT5897906.1 ABC transporter permease [Rhodospirillaceae bacterium]MBT6429195.1 ABC transporter permease [Rhodospirillaceae bacterium]MBT7760428.1 ABC transporter permease [Rhodospirillaceae bacterium]